MIQYIVNTETKIIEITKTGTSEEMKDLITLFKDYIFHVNTK